MSLFDVLNNPDIFVSVAVGSRQYVAHAGWEGVITRQQGISEFWSGEGYSNFFSVLNMQQDTGFVSSGGLGPPGGGDPNLLRWGFRQGTSSLNVFRASTEFELRILRMVYDTMLITNPNRPDQLIDWSTTRHTSTFNPTEVSCTSTAGCLTGTTTQTWRLRNDLKFHDGTLLTPDDVVYSILAYRDIPSASLQTYVSSVASAVSLDSRTVMVKLQGESERICSGIQCATDDGLYELGIGGLPILPKHKWEPICGPMPNPAWSGPCDDPAFDPMELGLLVGHGPWVCKEIVGKPGREPGTVGGSCSLNPDDSRGTHTIPAGGQLRFERNNQYHRGAPGILSSSLHKFSWADKNNDGFVNILDIADAGVECQGIGEGIVYCFISEGISDDEAETFIAEFASQARQTLGVRILHRVFLACRIKHHSVKTGSERRGRFYDLTVLKLEPVD